MHVEEFIIDFQRRDGDVDEMFQQRAIAGAAGLQLGDSLLAALEARRIFLRFRARGRVHTGKVVDGDGRFFRVRTGIGGIEIDQAGLFVVEFGDEVAHLQAPVAEVRVAGHMVAEEAQQAAERVADHGRAKVTDMHGLGDVRAAEVDDGDLRVARALGAGHGLAAHGLGTGGEGNVGDADIDETGSCDFGRQDHRMRLQRGSHFSGHVARHAADGFRRAHRAVALEVCEFRLVRPAHVTPLRLKAHGLKGGAGGRRQVFRQAGHGIRNRPRHPCGSACLRG